MYGNGQAPIFILKDGTQRTRGRSAQSNNIAAAKAVADAVRSTLRRSEHAQHALLLCKQSRGGSECT